MSMKRISIFCGLMVMCCLQFILQGQPLTSANSTPGNETDVPMSRQADTKTLKSLLMDLEKKYNVSFFYKSELVENKTVNHIDNSDKHSLEETLQSYLKPFKLTYEKVSDSFYVISPLKNEGAVKVELNDSLALEHGDSHSSSQDQLSVHSSLPESTVTGKVTSADDSQAIPGVNVLLKGTSTGTTTDAEGKYIITIPDANGVLIFSFIGYGSQEVPVDGRTTIDISLAPAVRELTEVVITALGISREKRTLTYATQNIKGSELSDSREINVTNALAGKVPGLTINRTNAGPGSSNRIVLRGNRSIAGNNQPLVVVDGVPIDNSPKAFAETSFGTRDNGDGISNINADDIESMSILPGPAAAALYGSAASNGAIMITTKKGSEKKGIGFQLSSSLMFESPMIYPKLQNVYGQGNGGDFIVDSEQSWGPRMEGQPVIDWTGNTQALESQPDNFKDFFERGSELMNSIAITSEQTYFSYTNTTSEGIVPNNDYRRNNFNLRQTTTLTKNLFLDAKANYIQEEILNRQPTGELNHAVSTAYQFPRSIRIGDVRNFEFINQSGVRTQNYWRPGSPVLQNPYWSVYRNLHDRTRNRILGLVSLRYQVTSELSFQIRSNIDYYSDIMEEKDYNDSYWITYPGGGNYEIGKESNRLLTHDALLVYNKKLSETFSLNVTAGASIEKRNFEGTYTNNQGLNSPNLFSVANAQSSQSLSSIDRTERQSVYGSAQVGYKEFLFVNLTGRNDWNSTLPAQNRSFFYPSFGVNAILSEMIQLPKVISLLKLNGAYAFVGSGTAYNQIRPVLEFTPGGNEGFLKNDRTLRNQDLKPENTRSIEAGLSLSLWENRIGADFTLYKSNTLNQILAIGLPDPSGYATKIINAGNIENNGIELLLTGKPIAGENFSWDVFLTYGANRNKIIRLDPLQKRSILSFDRIANIVVEEGKKYGDIYTAGFKRNEAGQIIVDPNGLPLITDKTYYAGNFNPDWTGGVTNTLRYKGLALSFLIDMRKGGAAVSHTQAILAGAGHSELTLPNREGEFVVPNSVKEDDTPNDIAILAEEYWTSIGGVGSPVGEPFVYDATNVRLREFSLSYSLPSALLNNFFIKGATLSLVGRNLFFLKNNAYGFDPEAAALGVGNGQGIEYASLPSTRSYGFHLRFNF